MNREAGIASVLTKMNMSPAAGNEIIQLAVCEMVVVWVQPQLRRTE
jgi:hypothetical protein